MKRWADTIINFDTKRNFRVFYVFVKRIRRKQTQISLFQFVFIYLEYMKMFDSYDPSISLKRNVWRKITQRTLTGVSLKNWNWFKDWKRVSFVFSIEFGIWMGICLKPIRQIYIVSQLRYEYKLKFLLI